MRDGMEDNDDFSIASNDDYINEITEAMHLGDFLSGDFDFDIKFMLDEPTTKNQYGDAGSVQTFKSTCVT